MTPAEILRAAKAKIEDPAHWCQGEYAKDALGQRASEYSDEACAWCAMGAFHTIDNGSSYDAFRSLAKAANEIHQGWGIPNVNDNTDHATVMRMFDRAIELAEASQ